MFKLCKIMMFIIFAFLLQGHVRAAEMILSENEKYFKAFYTQTDKIGWNVELKGKIISIGARTHLNESDMAGKVQDKTSVTVRLYNNLGINTGDILYAVDNNYLIIGKIYVTSVFKSNSFGYLLSGEGNLRLVHIGDRVVLRIENPSKYAFVNKAKGDYYQETGQKGEAISQYKSALEIDKGNPEAHISLGYIYLKDDMLGFAINEFKEAEKYKARIYDNEDKYLLYRGMSEVRFKEAYYTSLPGDLRIKYINEGIEYSKKALEIYPDSKEVNYYLGVFYYKNTEPSDVEAKDQFLRVIALDQYNIEAYIALAELYEKHNNRNKALDYAEQALKIDPANERAKFILKRLK